MATADKYRLAFTCIDVSLEDVPALHAMIERATDVSFRTFAKRCDWRQPARDLGYGVGPIRDILRIQDDFHVRFRRSTWKGQPCYFIVWSAIEHVFLKPTR